MNIIVSYAHLTEHYYIYIHNMHILLTICLFLLVYMIDFYTLLLLYFIIHTI